MEFVKGAGQWKRYLAYAASPKRANFDLGQKMVADRILAV